MPRERIAKRTAGKSRQQKPRRPERRIGGADSSTRAALLDAAEKLMRREGYAAVTSRKLASVAKLTPQLVHYYFRTMDDLFLALWQRFVDNNMVRHAEALASPTPFRAMWDMFRKSADIVLEVEFMGLAHHRKAIRARLARDGDTFRKMQVGLLARTIGDYSLEDGPASAEVLTVALTYLSRSLVLEQDLGMSSGHTATVRSIEAWLDRIEQRAARSRKQRAQGKRAKPSRR